MLSMSDQSYPVIDGFTVGGPQFGQINLRITIQMTVPMTMNTHGCLGEYFAANRPMLMPATPLQRNTTTKCIGNACPGLIFAILQARASKRNGPLVLAYAGGNA
jgi:hypothetical protein